MDRISDRLKSGLQALNPFDSDSDKSFRCHDAKMTEQEHDPKRAKPKKKQARRKKQEPDSGQLAPDRPALPMSHESDRERPVPAPGPATFAPASRRPAEPTPRRAPLARTIGSGDLRSQFNAPRVDANAPKVDAKDRRSDRNSVSTGSECSGSERSESECSGGSTIFEDSGSNEETEGVDLRSDFRWGPPPEVARAAPCGHDHRTQ